MTRRSRSRERSPSRRDRRRSRSRDRDRRHRHRRSRSRSPKRYRSRSPNHRRSISPRRRSRSRSSERSKDRSSRDEDPTTTQPSVKIDESQLEGKTEEEIAMMKTMGFCGFDTTKNKQVNKGDSYVANIQRKRRYRQYMNRKGGFNRPLDFIA